MSELFLVQDNQPLKGGRGHASMVLKCKLCGRENSIGNITQIFHSPVQRIVLFYAPVICNHCSPTYQWGRGGGIMTFQLSVPCYESHPEGAT